MDLDPTGKTPISFLQEYGLSVLKSQPEYRTSVQGININFHLLIFVEDPSNPFITTVFIGGTEYGTAAATSKKISKQLAAEKTLDILCPGLYHSKQKSFTDQKPKHLELKVFSSSIFLTNRMLFISG